MEVTFVETPVMGGSGPCSSLDWEDLGGHSAYGTSVSVGESDVTSGPTSKRDKRCHGKKVHGILRTPKRCFK